MNPLLPVEIMSLWSIIAGSMPKLIRSASESSSLPTFEYALSALALSPSQKSQTAATSISRNAVSGRPLNVQITPRTPQSRFMDVIVLGICLTIFMSIRLFYAEFLLDILWKSILVNNDIQGLSSYERLGSVPDTLVLAGLAP